VSLDKKSYIYVLLLFYIVCLQCIYIIGQE